MAVRKLESVGPVGEATLSGKFTGAVEVVRMGEGVRDALVPFVLIGNVMLNLFDLRDESMFDMDRPWP